MAKKLISINLDEDLIEEIDSISETLGMSRSAMVNLGMRGILMGETAKALGTFSAAVKKSKKAEKSEGKNSAKVRA